MKNILQLFKKMQPKSYYGDGVAVVKGSNAPACNESVYTVDIETDCRNIYSISKFDMPVQGIGLPRMTK